MILYEMVTDSFRISLFSIGQVREIAVIKLFKAGKYAANLCNDGLHVRDKPTVRF